MERIDRSNLLANIWPRRLKRLLAMTSCFSATLACGVLGAFAPRGEGGEQRSANQGETSPFLIFLYFSGSSGELWNFL